MPETVVVSGEKNLQLKKCRQTGGIHILLY